MNNIVYPNLNKRNFSYFSILLFLSFISKAWRGPTQTSKIERFGMLLTGFSRYYCKAFHLEYLLGLNILFLFYLFIYLFIYFYLFIYLFIYIFIYLFIYIFIYFTKWMASEDLKVKNSKTNFKWLADYSYNAYWNMKK